MRYRHSFLTIIVTGFVSGCVLTNPMTMFKDAKETRKKDVYNGETVLTSHTETEKQQLINQYINEWEELKPVINRIVAMEGDLSFVINELEKVNDTDGTALSITTLSQFEDSLVEDGVVEYGSVLTSPATEFDKQISKFATPNTKTKDKFSATKTQIAPTNVMLQAAKQVPLRLNENNSASDKFSNSKEVWPEQITASAKIPKADELECGSSLHRANKDEYAIHLASYSKLKSADIGQQQFLNKYASHLCNKSAVVKPVTVNGNEFYSLRFGPFLTSTDAQSVCSSIRLKDDYCTVSRFDGERVN